ncbi:MAG TPA: ferritin-like domain-containing protein [Methylotenera sp.]|nr:ferritin-like domain-containing protein [Methylotenera sp.]
MNQLRQSALHWLCETDAEVKANGVLALKTFNLSIARQDGLGQYAGASQSTLNAIPGRPIKPELVAPLSLPKRSMRTSEGRAALIHALAHIEFNAINLALDAVWRFDNMPENYYTDWLKVATEEAYHFSLLNTHLKTLGYAYGSFSGHNSLWEMVDKTKEDVLARMALVPRTMEARGLDASPALRNKYAQIADLKMAGILDIILHDEIGHVAIGNHWFNWLCNQRKLEPIATFKQLCQQYSAPKLKPPFNLEARRLAGFSDAELALL